MAHFQEQIDLYGDDDIRDMLKEVGERDDLRMMAA
jgi:hypothetical protein